MAISLGTPVFTFSGKKILFVDSAKAKYSGLMSRLTKDGILCEITADAIAFHSKLKEESFDLVFLNLMITGMGPNELLSKIRSSTRNRDLKVVILTKQIHKLNIQNAIQAGANDFIFDPFDEEGVYHRIQYHLRPKRIIDISELVGDRGVVPGDYVQLLLEANEALSRAKHDHEHAAFVVVIQKVAQICNSNRTSLIVVEGRSSGVVIASSDNPKFYDFPVALTKYPEILHVMSTGQFVCISDVRLNSLTSQITERVKDIPIGSIMVFPVLVRDEVIGVLTIRRPEVAEIPAPAALRALQALANTLAAYASMRASLRKIYREFERRA